MWSYYNVNYRQKVEATLTRAGQLLIPHFQPVLHWESYRTVQGCTNCSSLKHESVEYPHKNSKTSKAFIRSNKNKGPMCALTAKSMNA